MQRGVGAFVHTSENVNKCVCVCVQRYSSVKSPQAHIGSFLMPKLLCFFVLLFFNNLFVMFKTSQQRISAETQQRLSCVSSLCLI